MMMFAFILIVTLFSVYVFLPLFSRSFRNKRWTLESSELEDLLLRKQQVLVAISDLEYDLQMRKMSQQDYQQIKEKLMREGAAIMQALAERERPAKVSKRTGKAKTHKKAVA